MDVDIDHGRVERNPDHAQGVAADHEQAVVGILEGERQAPALNPAAVNEEDHALAVGTVHGRGTHPTSHRHARDCRRFIKRGEWDNCCSDLWAMDADGRRGQVTGAVGCEGPALIGGQFKRDLGVSTRIRGDDAGGVSGFG